MIRNFYYHKAKWATIIIISVVILIVAIKGYEYVSNLFNVGGNISPQRISLQELMTDKNISIRELKTPATSAGTYTIEGYVVHKSECSPCLNNRQCSPCAPIHIVISEKNVIISNYALTDQEVVATIDNNDPLTLGQRYRFIIEMADYVGMTENQRAIKIINFQAIK